jgi:haloalkane dehalogenase
MPSATSQAAGLAYREAKPQGEQRGTLLCLHGFPESSHMWEAVLEAAARAGWRALAPDLPGFGDSPLGDLAAGAGTWEGHIDAVARFHTELGLGPVVLVLHDWGGLIGLRWACDNAAEVGGIVASATGFFPDGKWHGMADAMRTPGQGEELAAGMTREGLAAVLRSVSRMDAPAMEACWSAFDGEDRRAAILALYRSGDFEKLAPYEGRLADLGVPAMLVWGADDAFAPLAGARRLRDEMPGAKLVVLEDEGHFVFDDAPQLCAGLVAGFLDEIASQAGASGGG